MKFHLPGFLANLSLRQQAVIIALVIGAAAFSFVWTFASASSQNRERIDAIRQVQVEACQRDNTLRAAEVKLWEFVINLSAATPRPDESAAEKLRRERTLAQFRAFLGETFGQHECAVTVDGKPKPIATITTPASPVPTFAPRPAVTATATATATTTQRVMEPGPVQTVCRLPNGRTCKKR